MFLRRRRYRDLAESMQEHLSERVEELVADGMTRRDAEFRARREFGNVTRIEEQSREVWQWPRLESMWADAKFAMRQLQKTPGFTVTAIVTLALGIAVNATMFSMVSAFLMPQLPGHLPEQMVVLSSIDPNGHFLPDANLVSPANYLTWGRETRTFAAMAAEDPYRRGSLAGDGEARAESVQYAAVSPNYFAVFGAVPQWGRSFEDGEDVAGRDHVAILSHGLWERRFHGDRAVIGKTVRLNRADYTVVGVMGADFRLLGFTEQLWTPLSLSAADGSPGARGNRSLVLFARLQAGVTLAQVRAEMHRLADQAAQDYPETEKGWGAAARMLPDYLVYSFGIRNALTVMMTIVGFVLLIACGNVAGLLLTRAVGRQKELAIRLSLGASRARLVRQLLTEGLVLALMGGGVGLLLSAAGVRFLQANLNFNAAISAVPVRLDRNVLLFALGISLLSALLSSLAPALKASRTDMNGDLKSEGRSTTGGCSQSRLRSVLVGGEIALAMALLVGSCLLIRGIYLLEHQKLGFERDHLLTAGVVLDPARYGDAGKQIEFERGILGKLEAIPGVDSAAIASYLPASGADRSPIQIRGEVERAASERQTALDVVVSTNYLRVAGIGLVRGRGFTSADKAGTPSVVLVNQEFVRRFFRGGDAVGRRVRVDIGDGPPMWSEIIGVVSDVKTFSEGPDVDPEVYQAFLQRPVMSFSLMLRSSVDVGTLTPALRQAVGQMDGDLPLLRVMSMEEVIESQRYGNPLFEQLLGTFALLALTLAAIGIYGLIAYSVGQRTQEIGIRLALGAKGSDIARMILRQGLQVAAIGAGVGLVLAVPLPRLFDAMFVGIRFGSVAIYPTVAAAMLMVVVFATWVPARRAARVDPTTALRSE